VQTLIFASSCIHVMSDKERVILTRRAGRPFRMDETTDNDGVKEMRRVDDARDDADLSRDAGEAQRPPVDATGVPQLDQVLGGGIPRGSLFMVVGPPGSGKTTLATQIAFASARAGRGALILTAFSEPASKLIAHLRAFRFFDEALVGGPVRILSLEQFLRGGDLATLAQEMLAVARETRAGLVLLDGFGGVRGLDGGAAHAGRDDAGDQGDAANPSGRPGVPGGPDGDDGRQCNRAAAGRARRPRAPDARGGEDALLRA